MRALGCAPDPVDTSDILLSRFIDHSAVVPEELSYIDLCSPVGNQGRIPACVGWGTTAIKETFDRKASEFTKLSPIWIYDRCKHLDDDHYGEGTYIRTAMKVLAREGCAPEALVPYTGEYRYGMYDTLEIDPNVCSPFRIKTYARLLDVDDMVRCLAQHGPFAMGIQVTDEFENVGLDGYVPIHFAKIEGGHCIAVVGYSIPKQTLTVFNSWGSEWGNGGFAELPFAYWERFGQDAWGVVDISPNEA
jgi:C1A family cysteine protease